MAKISFSPVAFEIRCFLDEGRRQEAIERTIRHLREGAAEKEFGLVAANLIELIKPKPKKRDAVAAKKTGRTKGTLVKDWRKIGERRDDLIAKGENEKKWIDNLISEFGSKNTVKKALNYYDAAWEAHSLDVQNG
jgi:hypothetical protein